MQFRTNIPTYLIIYTIITARIYVHNIINTSTSISTLVIASLQVISNAQWGLIEREGRPSLHAISAVTSKALCDYTFMYEYIHYRYVQQKAGTKYRHRQVLVCILPAIKPLSLSAQYVILNQVITWPSSRRQISL